ncbi:hypothetical protein B4102_2100 [Heyndrickxia sporothermodurans]|uniref:Uncharacterized protein n=1 Tax=Heyndrickxia sporothermodurans TaxID=46224 RepID=A0A150LHD6_9BACI|nr:hypothetical protein [Heyndrickxia sporothermodurans]KYD11660.1 hypothetical protein B4102_2100 [Heyndrickxia sporothermodurans]
MKKKTLLIIPGILIVFMASIFFYMKIEASKIQTPKDSFAEAKTDGFKDLNELAEKTPVIVKGKKSTRNR